MDQQHTCTVTISCDSQAAIPRLTTSIVVMVVAMYGECWLAWLLVCHYKHWIIESSRFCKFGATDSWVISILWWINSTQMWHRHCLMGLLFVLPSVLTLHLCPDGVFPSLQQPQTITALFEVSILILKPCLRDKLTTKFPLAKLTANMVALQPWYRQVYHW